MPRPCTTCQSPKHAEIDRMLSEGAATLLVAKQFDLSENAVRYHRENHVNPMLVLNRTTPFSVLRDLEFEKARSEMILNQVMTGRCANCQAPVLNSSGSAITGLKAIETHNRVVMSQARIAGIDRMMHNGNEHAMTVWEEVKGVIVEVLEEQYPEALDAILEKVEEIRTRG